MVDIDDILEEQVVKEKLAAHFEVESIQYYFINDNEDIAILVFEAEEIIESRTGVQGWMH